jgi:DNA-binding CsgD family transcriptional regulator
MTRNRCAGSALGQIIGAIGERDFPIRSAHALCGFTGFELAAIVLHRGQRRSRVIFDDFDRIGCRRGIETYARTTHRMNPMLGSTPSGAVRAGDFAGVPAGITATMRRYLVEAPDEELGYRTVGWPVRHEEIGLYFAGWGGLVEFGFYRERGRTKAPAGMLRALGELGRPVAAAFERHRALGLPVASWRNLLTGREAQIADLLLAGCSSDAVALRLSISRHTVKDHRKHIFRKLQVSSLAELFALSHRPPLRGDGDFPGPSENCASFQKEFPDHALRPDAD